MTIPNSAGSSPAPITNNKNYTVLFTNTNSMKEMIEFLKRIKVDTKKEISASNHVIKLLGIHTSKITRDKLDNDNSFLMQVDRTISILNDENKTGSFPINISKQKGMAYNKSVVQRFIKHQEKTDWGVSIHMIEESGNAYARTYWYDDDETVVFLEGLHVNKEFRRNGIASQLLDLHIQIARDNHASSQLKVKEGTWVYEWYKRKGYKDFVKCKESNDIWMILLP